MTLQIMKMSRCYCSVFACARRALVAIVVLCGLVAAPNATAADATNPAPDVIVFTNGDHLSGKFLRSSGDTLVFHSDIAGDVSVTWDKVSELRTAGLFAVIRKGQKINRKTPDSAVTEGTLTAANSEIRVQPVAANAPQAIAAKDVDFMIDLETFQKDLRHDPGFFHAWNGSIAAGAAFVQATQNSENLNVGVALTRAVPDVTWLSPRNRTTADFTDIYGKVHQSGIADTRTSIFHADAERDEYLAARFFVLGNVSFDHNYSQGLSLEQIYGAGVGYTVIKQPVQELDAKADIHYEKQSFSADPYLVPVPAVQASTNLVGSSLGQTYWRKLPRGLMFNETGVVNLSFNDTRPYSSNVAAGLVFPVYKRFSFNVGAVDSYLNNPPTGFKNNSFQFTTGIGYTLR